MKNLKSTWICTGLSTDPSVLRLNKNILDTGNELTFLVDFNGVKSSFRIKKVFKSPWGEGWGWEEDFGEHMVFRGNGGRGGGQSSSKEFKEGL